MMGNIQTIKMPDIGEGVVEGEIVEWLKKVGDVLLQDEPVLVVMTDKATVELPSPFPGVLAKQYFQAGQIAIKDQPLYDVQVEGAFNLPMEESLHILDQQIDLPARLVAEELHLAVGDKALASPVVRKLAKSLDINLKSVKGSGTAGRVLVEDLKLIKEKKACAQTMDKELDDEEKLLVGVRRLMAEKMTLSKERIPHFSYFEKVEVTRLVALREKIKLKAVAEGVQVTFMPFFIKALSLSIQQFPEINSSFDEEHQKIIIHHHHHIGVAVASPQGLVVAVLHDVQNKTFDDLARGYEDLKLRASKNQLKPHETKGSTITISNFGAFGGHGLWATPIINFPEVAILAVDRIQKQPTVKQNEVVSRDILNLSWSFDHRVIDGEVGAKVSKAFCDLLANPAPLL